MWNWLPDGVWALTIPAYHPHIWQWWSKHLQCPMIMLVWLWKHLAAPDLLPNIHPYIYGHGKHVETGYQVWCANLGPYMHTSSRHLSMVIQNTSNGYGVVMNAFGGLLLVVKHSYTYIYGYGHGKHVETGCQAWCVILGPYRHTIPSSESSGNGSPKHLRWLWCGYESSWQLVTCYQTLIYTYMDMRNMWNWLPGVVWALYYTCIYHLHIWQSWSKARPSMSVVMALMKALGSLGLVAKHSSVHIWKWKHVETDCQVRCVSPGPFRLIPPPHLAVVIENTFNVFGVVIKALVSFLLLVSKPSYIQIWAWKWCVCTPDLAHLGIYPPWTNWILHTLHLVLHIQQYTPWTLCILCCTVDDM